MRIVCAVRAAYAALAAWSAAARAEPASTGGLELAALAPAKDARQAVAIGPSGQVYEPDGHGAWIRRKPGGIAGVVAGGARAGANVLAITHDGPAFRLSRDGWTVVHFGAHAKAIVGAGPRPLAAVGRVVFALDKSEPTKLTEAPAAVVAIAASAGGAVVETERGLARLDGNAWKPLAGAPHQVAALLSDRLALVDHGLYDLRTNKTIAWPAGVRIVATTALTDDGALAIAQRGAALELVTVRNGKLAREPIPADGGVVGVAGDGEGRVVLALRDGRLVVRDRAGWSTVQVRDELPPPHPGAPPAMSR